MDKTVDPEDFLMRLRRKFSEQSAELVNKGGIPPLTLMVIMNEAAIALAIVAGVSRAQLAGVLREQADAVERLNENRGQTWN